QQIVTSGGLEFADSANKDQLKEAVRQDEIEALIVYPQDIETRQQFQFYISSTDLTITSSLTGLADNLLKSSIYAPLGSASVIALAQNGAAAQITTYDEGQESAGFNA